MSFYKTIEGFGEDIQELKFKDSFDWFIHIRDPIAAYNAQPTYILSELLFYTFGALTLTHAFIVGGRWKYYWLATYLHGLTTEMTAFWLPQIDNYWHSQTCIILLGRRLPLHITFLYPIFMYTAAYAVAHMKLPRWAEPMAAGLGEVLIDLPYDIMAVRFLHWTWHDTDPNIYDRHYWVPWTSYFFHVFFGTAFSFSVGFWRRRITGHDDKEKTTSCGRELLCSLLAGLCGMPGGVLQFMVFYHPLHDVFGVHTENCVLGCFVVYVLIVWSADRTPAVGSRRQKGQKTHWTSYLLVTGLLLHYGFWLSMAVFGNPDREVSVGLHERVGPCDQIQEVPTAFGVTLQKRKYLCSSNYDEQYFTLNCTKTVPKPGTEWYTVCGTPFTSFNNRVEYIAMISVICIIADFVFYNLLYRSSPTLRAVSETKKLKKK